MIAAATLDAADLKPIFVATLAASTALIVGVARGWTHGLDRRLLSAVIRTPRAVDGPTRLTTAARDLTALGGDTLRLLFLAFTAVGLFAAGRSTTAWRLIAIFVTARAALVALKQIVRRPRPGLVPHHVATYTSSFPSGHTFMTVVLFVSAALLIPVGSAPAVQATALLLAVATGAAIGLTRIALGIHWPTDVAAGWLGGVAWATGCALLVTTPPGA